MKEDLEQPSLPQVELEQLSGYFTKYKRTYYTVYLIENSTGYYIGSTSTDINYRLGKHMAETRYNKARYNWLQESLNNDPVTITELQRTDDLENAKLLEKAEIINHYKKYKDIKPIFNKYHLPK